MKNDLEMIYSFYHTLPQKIEQARRIFGRSLTFTEKILFSHLSQSISEAPKRGKSYVSLTPDRVAMQDATAQMALLQFMLAGRETSAVPATVHCDHLIQARRGEESDLPEALNENKEVYDFLSAVAKKYGMGFSSPGAGIIHQIIFENLAFPGGLIIGTDSHTPNAGGMGMIGIGVGGADAVDAMVGMPWELKWPKLIGVRLKGTLKGWASPKDIIVKLAGLLTVKGGTGCVIEYFGEGLKSLSATGKATITNMGAEVGATSSVFPFDQKIEEYLRKTQREEIADRALSVASCLKADLEVENNPEKYFDQIIELDLNTLEPQVCGPFTPDLVRSVSELKKEAKEKKYPLELKAGLIGSCTNSSYEDLSRVAFILKEALKKKIKPRSLLYISPGSEKIKKTIEKDGILEVLEKAGAVILTNACGPCIGQWKRQDIEENIPNSIITSFNRNFKARNDGNPETLAFIGSPELIAAMVVSGRIDFDPARDTLLNDEGQEVRLEIPEGKELPDQGFFDISGLSPEHKSKNSAIEIRISKTSDRLQALEPFKPWDGRNTMDEQLILLKISGKCTTDHISPAGKWLKYRGHLDNISENMFLGAMNAYTGETGKGTNQLTREKSLSLAKIARFYKAQNRGWVAIGDENYGEGSSREHAAMEPRHLGCSAIIARSFARIAENNLKKQGILVATFVNPGDYDKIKETDTVSLSGLSSFKPGSALMLILKHADGRREEIPLQHSFSEYQIEWFKAGSALNLIRNSFKKSNGG